MKQVSITLAVLALLATPASALTAADFGSGAGWDCGKGLTFGASKGSLGVQLYWQPLPFGEEPTPAQLADYIQGARNIKLTWDFRKGEVWVNGRRCTPIH